MLSRNYNYQSTRFGQNIGVRTNTLGSDHVFAGPGTPIEVILANNGIPLTYKLVDALLKALTVEINLTQDNTLLNVTDVKVSSASFSEDSPELMQLVKRGADYAEQLLKEAEKTLPNHGFTNKDDIRKFVLDHQAAIQKHLEELRDAVTSGDVHDFTAISEQEKQGLQNSVDKFKNEQGIAAEVKILDKEFFDRLKAQYDNGTRKPEKDVTLLLTTDDNGNLEKHFVYKEGMFVMPTEKVIEGTGEVIALEGTKEEVGAIRDKFIDKAIENDALEGVNIDKSATPYLNIFEKGMWVIKVTKETLAEIKVPEPIWHKEKFPTDYPFGVQPLAGGVGDGLVDEVKSVPDLVIFALSLFDQEELGKLGDFVTKFDFGMVKKMFTEKVDKYDLAHPEVAYHEGGYDGVQVASMFWGGLFTKGKNASKTVDEVDGFVNKIDDVVEEIAAQVPEDLSKLSGKTQAKIFKELANDPKLLQAVNENPAIAKALTQHKQVVDQADLEKAQGALETLDESTRQKALDLIEESEKKSLFMGLMQKARNFDELVVNQKLIDDFGVENLSSQITLKVTNKNGTVREIVADYLVKDGDSFRIVDSKFTQKTDFNIEQSLTPNQKDSFDWLRNDQVQSIEVRANPEKLNNFPDLRQGDNLDLNQLKVDIYTSKPDLQVIDKVTNIF